MRIKIVSLLIALSLINVFEMVSVGDQNVEYTIIETKTSETTYYVDPVNGSDSNDGLSEETAWKTITKVNSMNFQPGDLILFRRGGRWNECLSIPSSGSENNPIIFGAYGKGARPLIYNTNAKACINIEDVEYIIIQDFELKNAERGIWITGLADGNIKLDNIIIHDMENDGIGIKERRNILIENCEIYNCKGNGISTSHKRGPENWTMLANHNITVKKCIIYNNYKNGIAIKGHSAYIANNTIYSNGKSKTRYYHNIYLIGDNATVEHNVIYSSPEGDGFRYEGGYLKMRYNYIHDNGKHEISFWNDFPDRFFDNEIYYNIIDGTDDTYWGISIDEYAGGFNGIKIYNNVIYSRNPKSRGISLRDCSNVDLKNNIVFVKGIALSVDEEGAYGFSSDYNCWLSDIKAPFKWNEGYIDFMDFKSLGFDIHSYFADPLFVGLDENNFHLQSSSPAIDAGIDLGYSLDFDGNPVPTGSSPDIGVFEFQGEQGLRCNGALHWSNIKPSSTVNSSFTIENAGSPNSEINWRIIEWPSWGVWSFTPSSGNLRLEDGPITVKVSVIAPDEQNKEFDGVIKIVNKDNSSDFCILSVSLTTTGNKKIINNYLLIDLLKSFIKQFPLFSKTIQDL